MARITHVKKAQQRYAMVQEYEITMSGDRIPRQTPVLNRDGSQKVTKRGKLVWRNVTHPDTSKPLPPNKCDRCGKEINVGDSYKHVTPKSGPYGGRTRYRCFACPNWEIWELSSSLAARTAEIEHTYSGNTVASAESEDDVRTVLEEAAQAIRDLADEKRDSANNIEEGFGHETSASAELNDIADNLEGWADEVEGADVPEYPEPEERCERCDGTGELSIVHSALSEVSPTCFKCNGEGHTTPDEPTEDQVEWRDQAQEVVDDALGNCPV